MMAKQILFYTLLVLSMFLSRTISKDYKVATFEHHPFFVNTEPLSREEALKIMRKNTAVYSEQARAAKKQGAQIIVFPEDGIYGFFHTRETIKPYLEPIPTVSNTTSIIPCTDPKPDTEILQELSCMARDNSIALVANMGDIQYCSPADPNCPNDGRYQYNTDVIFDSDGRLLAKYHKQHLFYEKAFNTPTKCEFVTFVTSFQVRFGVFTCFDMLFKSPAIDLVKIYGVQNIVVPTAWNKGFPVLISIEYHQAWSRVNCVNLVMANVNYPSSGLNFTGTGIYDCGEAKTYTYDEERIEKRLLFATLSGNKKNQYDKTDMLYRLRRSKNMVKEFGQDTKIPQNIDSKIRMLNGPYDSTKTFKAEIMRNVFTLTKLTSRAGELSVCVKGLCCNLKYSLAEGNQFTETFAMGTFIGDNPDGFYWEVCLLLKCASSKESSCGTSVMDSGTIFESFTINGNFSSTALVFPLALGSGASLFSTNKVKFTNKSISGEALQKPLLTASLLGRVYTKDKPQD